MTIQSSTQVEGGQQMQFKTALFDLMKELQTVKIEKDAINPYYSSRYPSLKEIQSKIMPVLIKHKFMVVFKSFVDVSQDLIGVKLEVSHVESGVTDYAEFTQKGILSDTQKIGSFQTYSRRYLLVLYFNLNIEDDDDGNRASNRSSNGKDTKMPLKQQATPVMNNTKEVYKVADKHYELPDLGIEILIDGETWVLQKSYKKDGSGSFHVFRSKDRKDPDNPKYWLSVPEWESYFETLRDKWAQSQNLEVIDPDEADRGIKEMKAEEVMR